MDREAPMALIFGAGKVGRGFLGHLLSRSDYQLCFVDRDAALVERLARPWLRQGYDAVVMGHFHLPLHYRGADGEFLILGDWLERRSYARLQEGKFSLLEFEAGA